MAFIEMFESIAQRAEQAAKSKSLHKEADGMLHCDVCGEPVQSVISVMGESKTVFCTCRCDWEAEAAEKKRRDEEERQRRVDYLRAECFGLGDSTFRDWTFASSDGKQADVERTAHKFCDRFGDFKRKGKGLLFYGGTGTGKTFTAACIANELTGAGVSVMMTNFAKIVNRVQEKFEGRQRYLDSLNKFDLLIIDDLAAERNTEFVNEIVYNVIDSRYSSGLPLIVTTNISPKDMIKEGEITRNRIYSRLYQMCYAIEVKGKDRRKEAAAREVDELRALLGV